MARARRNGAERFLWQPNPPGHFASPIPSASDVERALGDVDECPELAFDLPAQHAWWDRLEPHFESFPFPHEAVPEFRYHCDNTWFSFGEAQIYFATLLALQPARVIEIGSGYTSALLLDVADRYGVATDITFIEPYPDRLSRLLRAADGTRTRVLPQPVQDVPTNGFAQLGDGDLLFVDSSHVGKAGSDVLHVLFRVLPSLAPGVYVHFHDVLWPFEYPSSFFEQGRAWNEAYFLRAFLAYNTRFEVVFMNSFFEQNARDAVEASPLHGHPLGSSLWLRTLEPR